MPKFLLGAIILLAFVACKNTWTSRVEDDFSLKMELLGCRGLCPRSVLEINSDGLVRYQGKQGVDKMGRWSKTLAAKSMKTLDKVVEESGFWDMKTSYGESRSDLQTIIISISHRGKSHEISDYSDAPVALKSLEAKIEALVGQNGYVSD